MIVERVEPGSSAEQAGLRPGDRLSAYGGRLLLSPSALLALEENTFGVESVTLTAERAARTIVFTVKPGRLGIETRPDLPAAALTVYELGRQAFAAQQFAEAAHRWSEAAPGLHDSPPAAWLNGKAGAAWECVRDWSEAQSAYERAYELLLEAEDTAPQAAMCLALGRCSRKLNDLKTAAIWYEQACRTDELADRPIWAARNLDQLGDIACKRSDLDLAQDCHTRSLAIRERLVPDSLEVAASHHYLGLVAHARGNVALAEHYVTRSLAVRERLASDSLDVAASLNSLGDVHYNRGDLALPESHYAHALAIHERLAPDSLEMATSLDRLGSVAWKRGDWDLAQDYHTRALMIQERLAPDSLEVAMSLISLGTVTNDLERGRDYCTRALIIYERITPDSWNVAMSLNNLGNIARMYGDLALAQEHLTRSLILFERLAPDSLVVATCLANLGNVATDLDQRRDYCARSLAIREHLAPDSLDVAACLNNLAQIAFERSDLAQAQDYLTRSHMIYERLSPGSWEVATILTNLGLIAIEANDPASAKNYVTRALTTRERLGPDSSGMADSLECMGRIFLHEGRPAEAMACFRQAVEIIERQRARISSPEARALLLAQHIHRYADLIRSYLALKDLEAAFLTLERARARSFLELLVERSLDFALDAPSELLQQQEELDRQRAHANDQLSRLSDTTADLSQIETLHQTLRELERQQQGLVEQVRAASPRYASLQYPQPLSLQEAQATLEPGTLLLSYLVDEEQTFLFAVTNSAIKAYTLPLGYAALQEQVRSLREALDQRRLENRTPEAAARAVVLGRQIYTALVGPALTGKRGVERLMICPDGPLHILPFGALVTNRRGSPRYLGTERPMHSILSVTIHAQTAGEPKAETAAGALALTLPATPEAAGITARVAASLRRLLAFGDPIYSSMALAPGSARSVDSPERTDGEQGGGMGASAEDELAALQTRGMALGPLPHTRAEALCLARLFGEAATVKLGAEANRASVLKESADADILHFACHAWFNPKMPLSSGLALSRSEALDGTPSSGDNGLLQAWEIFGRLRLRADLVVLSACQTGLGQEVRGEGLVGLTRAFQYAGAKSLVVSLWEVDDESTPVFMEAFYTALKAGLGKDEALREGTRALKAHPRWNHPYYWSAFVLIGDRSSIQVEGGTLWIPTRSWC